MTISLAATRTRVLHVSASAQARHSAAAAWLAALPARAPALLLVPNPQAGLWLAARVLEQAGSARLGWRRHSLEQHAEALAQPQLLASGTSVMAGAAAHALCIRVLQCLRERTQLGRFAAVSGQPGFVRALWQTLCELRMAEITPEHLAQHDPDLAHYLQTYEQTLADSQLCDLAGVYQLACSAAATDPQPHVLALDVPIKKASEARFLQVLTAAAGQVWASVPLGDEPSHRAFKEALGPDAEQLHTATDARDDLGRLQTQLFVTEGRLPAPADENERVRFISSPGESREAVEVARELLAAAHSGVPFDRMAVLVRAVDNYRAVLEEAFARADVPAHFAAGVRRPAPEGRAFAVLLACAERGLSARRFGEYLSLAVMPRTGPGTVSPRHWERLLVEASVSGGRERWLRRLAGLAQRWQTELEAEPHGSARHESLQRQLSALVELERFALPLLETLEALPARANCEVWFSALWTLSERALHEPSAVQELLQTLTRLGSHTTLSLRELSLLLAPHLNALIVKSQGHGAGQVFVGAIDEARGRSFERVFVVGLAERLFPPRLREDPLLPDRLRRKLSAALSVSAERIADERLLLRLAAGAASEQLCFTFPRFDTEQMRPRVPSFYGLEALEAIHGRLLSWSELGDRADLGAATRLGWPAPELPARAIDDAEYDLAVLAGLAREPERRIGALRYLLDANPFLARALRFRARRWELPKFVAADGFVVTDPRARELLAAHALSERTYSTTSLEQLAICPYRFYLHAIARVAELDTPSELSELGPRERGLLFHDVLRRTLERWLAERTMQLSAADPSYAQSSLEEAFDQVRQQAEQRYAPTIARVFDVTLASLRRDLSGWLTQLQSDREWVPVASELPLHSQSTTQREITLDQGVRLSGAIDLVERQLRDGAEVLRATDFKTGAPGTRLSVTQGAHVLQPLLYALALERMFPEAQISGGRLYFCTQEQRYTSQEVPLGERARSVARELFEAVNELLQQGFLPAAPENGACASCEYAAICGPHEQERVTRVKQRDNARLRQLHLIRRLP